MKENKLAYYEAKTSPCEACTSCPCCFLFQLDCLTTSNLIELDTINYYLNFDNIEVCLSGEGKWTVYYDYPCRFFDAENSICTPQETETGDGACKCVNVELSLLRSQLIGMMKAGTVRANVQMWET